MNKEEILELSRSENKGQDIYENEIVEKGNRVGVILACVLATIFFITQIILGGGTNYGLYAILGAIFAGTFLTKGIYLKKKHELCVAIAYIVLTICCSVAHIYQLFTMYTIR